MPTSIFGLDHCEAFSDVMDTNALIDLVQGVRGQLWEDRVNETLRTGRFCEWVSSFHPDKLPCQLDGTTFHHGAFNAGLKMVFSNKTAWMVRFPRVGNVCDDYSDEKVTMEVAALSLIDDRTTIPVPTVQAWGSAASNLLGLGPFIMMDFIEGVSLNQLLRDPNAEQPTRLIREDISDGDIEIIYRQLANYLLQLFQLDFDQIGSLPSPGDEAAPTPARPLTFKAHCILQNGGVDTFGDRNQGFPTTTEYFQHVIGQDWEQLVRQPNSIMGFYNAKARYLAFKVLRAIVPDLVNAQYDSCKFKLICDDLGLANLIVRSKDDLTVIGVIDLEWSYIGPAQLFGSAPWWLLQDRPVNSEWDYDGDQPPKIAARYFKYLEIFIRILEEEERKMPGHEKRELSSLVKWSQASGAMWLHMLISAGFNDHRSFPFTQLRQHIGASEWTTREQEFRDTEVLEAFAALKVKELAEYDEALEKMEEEKALVDSGKMTKEEFIANALKAPRWPSSSSPIVDDEMRKNEALSYQVAAWLALRVAQLRAGATSFWVNWKRLWGIGWRSRK